MQALNAPPSAALLVLALGAADELPVPGASAQLDRASAAAPSTAGATSSDFFTDCLLGKRSAAMISAGFTALTAIRAAFGHGRACAEL
jgi:hypothetical protein